jgi:MtN3 and saliva related transmembrane protein
MDTLGLTLLGTVAGLCTTASFVPQVVKAWGASDTQAISLRMYWVSLAAFVLWIVHGLMVERLPIVVFNAFNLILGGLVLWLTLRGRRSGTPGAAEAPACEPDAADPDGLRPGPGR